MRNVGYEEICRGIDLLCAMIDSAEDGWRPEAIVAVVRGGLVPATHLCHHFRQPIFFIRDYLLLESLGERRRILVVDEINDTGQSFHRIRADIFGRPPDDKREVRYAALYTRYTTSFQADYFLDFPPYYVTDDVYQLFPWE